jgi:predicted RNase H-like HicB family nuclease
MADEVSALKKHTEHQDRHFSHYTAKYTKITTGYMGQLVEWPEIVTEGKSLEECRAALRNALEEMIHSVSRARERVFS